MFREFYENYGGPFSSRTTGFSLLDLADQDTNICSQTSACREVHGWPLHLIVLSDYLGNSVLVLDSSSGRVYNVDFEGSDALLLTGNLEPAWESFGAFLETYFG